MLTEYFFLPISETEYFFQSNLPTEKFFPKKTIVKCIVFTIFALFREDNSARKECAYKAFHLLYVYWDNLHGLLKQIGDALINALQCFKNLYRE